MRRITLAFVFAAFVAAGPALAGGGQRGDWELGPYGGFMWADDYGTFHPKDDLFYGARLGYFLSNHWNLELAGQRFPSETDPEESAFPGRDVKIDALRMSMLYSFAPGSALRPFLVAGAGREMTQIEGFDRSTDWGVNAGAGFRLFFTPNFNFRADGRFVSMMAGDPVDERQENFEATAGLNLVFGGRSPEPEDTQSEPPLPNQPPQVSCTTDRSEILPGESVGLAATASDPEGEPLTFAWSTTAGKVMGSGANATLDLAGATAPTDATVTVRVSDTSGNTTSSQCAVRVLEPVRQAEAVSCMAGGFPRNLSRLTNVDKACLDDMAQRLKADPRARIVVIGHADDGERSPERVGKERADAVEDYLEQAGIDASRIETRSAASTRMLDAATDMTANARNRRVEIWFVPEGARIPE